MKGYKSKVNALIVSLEVEEKSEQNTLQNHLDLIDITSLNMI